MNTLGRNILDMQQADLLPADIRRPLNKKKYAIAKYVQSEM
jgi:hypothetical protein